MKLSSIKQTLTESLPLLNSLSYTYIQNQGGKFENIQAFKKGVEKIKTLNLFDDLIQQIESFQILESFNNNIIVNTSQAKHLKEKSKEFIEAVLLLARTIDKVDSNTSKNEENLIYIKLPNTHNLQQLSKDIKIFDKILSNTILDEKIDGQVVLESVEPGSIWLKIYVGSSIAVNLIGSLTWSATLIYKKYQESMIIEEIANQKQLENQHRKNLIDASKMLTDLIVEAEAEKIYDTYYLNGEVSAEQIERIKASVRMLSEEIGRGAEVNPSLTASEDVKNLFPDLKTLPTLESKTKKIE